MKQRLFRLLRDETGQTLPLALIILAIGSLFVGSFLTTTNTNLLNSRVYSRPFEAQYAADSGVEDAIWNLKYGTFTTLLASDGDQTTYNPTETINGSTVEVTVIVHQPAIASHDFNDSDWNGGTGWLAEWTHSGDAAIRADQNPYEGSRHLRLRNSDGYAARSADLSGSAELHLRFWAKVRSFESGDEASCLVSPDGSTWTTVKTWTSADSDDTYHPFDFDLTPYTLSAGFWIAFDADMNSANDHFYVDDVKITGTGNFEILSTADGHTTRAFVSIEGGEAVIQSWVLD